MGYRVWGMRFGVWGIGYGVGFGVGAGLGLEVYITKEGTGQDKIRGRAVQSIRKGNERDKGQGKTRTR